MPFLLIKYLVVYGLALNKKVVKIGTRGSALALWQATWIKNRLEDRYPEITLELIKIKTKGDKISDVPLSKIGGKGLFVKEIEQALMDGRIDMAVHSMKDVPTEVPHGLYIGIIPKRDDPRDVLIAKRGGTFRTIKRGAKIGTSSLRRKAQLLYLRKDLQVVPLRGNLDTRIRKLDKEDLDAIIVASAGVRRMELQEKVSEYLSLGIMLPAIGQGALGIELRQGDEKMYNLVAFLDHHRTRLSIEAERSFLKRLGGGCQVPIAALGILEDKRLKLQGLVADTEGTQIIKDQIEGEPSNAQELGRKLAERLLRKGAQKILDEVYGGKR